MSDAQIRLAKPIIDPIAWKIQAEAIVKKHFTSEWLEEVRLGTIEANQRLASFGFERSPLNIWNMDDVFYMGRIIDRDLGPCNLSEVMEIVQLWHDQKMMPTRIASMVAAAINDRTTAQRETSPAAPTVTSSGGPEGGTQPTADAPPSWIDLGCAKQAILTVLNTSTDRMQGMGIAKKAGYKPGTLRHHYQKLQDWNYIEKTNDGYAITTVGGTLVPCKSVQVGASRCESGVSAHT